ncbi:MAG: gas vesicle protein [bacterium]
MENKGVQRSLQGATLVDLLDRILDKGLVVAGDIVIQLADVELLTIKIRLLVCSVDKAQEIGMDWWRHDTFLNSAATPKLFENQKKKPESAVKIKTLGKIKRAQKDKESKG